MLAGLVLVGAHTSILPAVQPPVFSMLNSGQDSILGIAAVCCPRLPVQALVEANASWTARLEAATRQQAEDLASQQAAHEQVIGGGLTVSTGAAEVAELCVRWS